MSRTNNRLVERFFEIMEDGGSYVEIFLIRDLLMKEYIEGRFTQVEILQIDDIIECNVMPEIESHLNGAFEHELDNMNIITNKVYECIFNNDIDEAFRLVNKYGDLRYKHPYVYYSMVRELERVTGETYIELSI